MRPGLIPTIRNIVGEMAEVKSTSLNPDLNFHLKSLFCYNRDPLIGILANRLGQSPRRGPARSLRSSARGKRPRSQH